MHLFETHSMNNNRIFVWGRGGVLRYFLYLCNLKVWDETGMANVS